MLSQAAISVAVVVCSTIAGALTARLVAPSLHSRDFPWITGRALGIASYLCLFALEILGLWMRHPWRFRLNWPHAEARLRAHAALAIATVVLVAGHLSALALDSYAGVGWWGAFVPGMSSYRTTAVALGVVAFMSMLAIALSAGLAGRRGTKHWLAIHHCAGATFALVWVHGLLAGTDAQSLRLLYVVTGATWLGLGTTRLLAAPAQAPGSTVSIREGAHRRRAEAVR